MSKGFCTKCKKLIRARIAQLESFQKDIKPIDDRAFLIDQLNSLIEHGDEL